MDDDSSQALFVPLRDVQFSMAFLLNHLCSVNQRAEAVFDRDLTPQELSELYHSARLVSTHRQFLDYQEIRTEEQFIERVNFVNATRRAAQQEPTFMHKTCALLIAVSIPTFVWMVWYHFDKQ